MAGRSSFDQTYGYGNYSTPSLYNYRWTPYISRTPNVNTEVVFHVLLDTKLGPVDSVRLNGNLAVMSACNGGVEMVMVNGNPLIWSVSLHLPFSMTDFCVSGMFQFHYEIVRGTEVIVESQGERTEQRLKRHFFHSYRPDMRVFRHAYPLIPKVVVQSFVLAEVSLLKSNAISLGEAICRFHDLADSCVGCNRLHVEEAFEDALDIVEETVYRVRATFFSIHHEYAHALLLNSHQFS